jgi:beta-carotene ketolase (CrtO type)
MFNSYLHNDKNNIIHSLNSPPSNSPLLLPSYSSSSPDLNKQTNLENKQELDLTLDSEYRSKVQSLRSWCNEYFESEEAKVFFGAWPAHVCASPDDAGGGNLAYLLSVLVQDGGNNVVKGGMVNLPLALSRYLQARGGRIITGSGVSKIIINNKDRKAVGIRLDNGREIAIRQLVVSSIDPITLVFNLIGQEYFDSSTIQSLKRYEWGDAILTMYLALDSQMEYNISSEALQSTHVHLSEPSLDYFAKIFYECRSGKLPSEPFIIASNDSIADPSRAPTGMHLMKLLLPGIPYKIKRYNNSENHTDRRVKKNTNNYNYDDHDCYEIKNEYSDKIIEMVSEKYIPNLKSILKKKVVYSPIDLEKNPTTSVRGTLSCGAMLPYQIFSMRPIPQFSGYRIPDISNVYVCGSANHPGPGVSMAPGRNAAQVIYADLGLDFKNLAIQ